MRRDNPLMENGYASMSGHTSCGVPGVCGGVGAREYERTRTFSARIVSGWRFLDATSWAQLSPGLGARAVIPCPADSLMHNATLRGRKKLKLSYIRHFKEREMPASTRDSSCDVRCRCRFHSPLCLYCVPLSVLYFLALCRSL